MKPLLGFVLLLTALSTSAAGADAARGAARKPAKEPAPENAKRAANAKRILLITGEDYQRRKRSRIKGHVWQETAPALRDQLQKDTRLAVDLVDDLTFLRSQELAKYAAVVMHFKNYDPKVPGRAGYDNLASFVEKGGGLVLVHFACGAFQEFKDDFVKLGGRVWNPKMRGHDRFGTFQVEVTKPDHPALAGLKSFETTDELYTCLDGDTPIDVLASAVSKVDGKTYPVVFVLKYGKGRVFHCPLGHNVAALTNEPVAELFRRGTAWVAGMEAVERPPKNFGDMKVWFKQPAKGRGETLALGNGRIGAVLYGGTESARIDLSEETLWTHGPKCRDRIGAHKHLPKLWELLDQGQFAEADALMQAEFLSPYTPRRQEKMADLHLDFEGHGRVSDYRRELDFDTAVSTLSYRIGDASFTRQSFISVADQALVMIITCDKPGKLTFDSRFSRKAKRKNRGEYFNSESFVLPGTKDTLVLRGKGDPPGVGLKFETHLKIMPKGGKVIPGEKSIRVEGADRVVLMLTAATNFKRGTVDGPEPSKTCREHMAKAVKRDVVEMMNDHIAEHRGYFRRASLELGTSTAEQKALPTDQRLGRFKKTGKRDPGLEELLFQFGRYLLISASRPGTQATTLYGIWPPGYSMKGGNQAFHLDINIAENYWPAETTGLGDCHLPLVDLLIQLVPNGKKSARNIFDCNGAMCAINVDGWLATGSYGRTHYAGQWVSGLGWHTQHAWNHYDYSGDKKYLRDRAWPLMKEVAEFYMDYNRPDPKTGKIYIGPSGSPETGFQCNGRKGTVDYGISMDQEIAHEVLSNCLKAARVLEIDDDFARRARETLSKLALPKISKDGRLMEWRTEREGGEKHRHRSHLYGFSPGQRLSIDTHPEECAAVRKSLVQRLAGGKGGDGFAHIDWSKAWALNQWARFREQENYDKTLENFLRTVTAPNLCSLCLGKCEYLMDGNGAITAGMAEGVLQSRERTIYLLPCLSKAWQKGSFSGFRARGGVTIDASWTPESVTATFTVNRDGTFEIRHEDEVRKVDLKAGVPMKMEFKRK